MTPRRYRIVYDSHVIRHLQAIERRFHSLTRITIETQLAYEPQVQARNRKPLARATPFGARWELRLGDNNQFRIFCSVDPDKMIVSILAIGVKRRERLVIGGRETE